MESVSGRLAFADISKTKELIIDFRKKGAEHAPIYINGAEVKKVESVKFLGVTITNNLSWTSHIDTMVKKAQQHLFFLRTHGKFGMSTRILTNIHKCTIESIIFGRISAWYGNCSAQDHKKRQEVANLVIYHFSSFITTKLVPCKSLLNTIIVTATIL
eukprot:g44038.t1